MTTPKEALEGLIKAHLMDCEDECVAIEVARKAIPVAKLHEQAMNIVLMILDQNVNLTKVFVKANKLRPQLEALK